MIDPEYEKCLLDDACKLLGLHYEVYTEYHFRVGNRVDIYPSEKKYYTFEMNKAEKYDNIENTLRSVFQKFKKMEL